MKATDYLDQAWKFVDEEDFEAALISIEKALEISPKHWYLWATKARILEESGRYADADDAARTSLRFDDTQPRVWNILALLAFKECKYNEAIEAFKKSLELEEDFGTLTMLASAELNLDPHKALFHANRALEINPDWEEAQKIRDEAAKAISDL